MYHPLDTSRKEIRLLHVLPGAWNDDIRCHLEITSLSDHPQFQAISYVWGDPAITLPITVDGQQMAIIRNLRNGLQRLRSEDETIVIFADAACINQSNLDERSQQVQLMGEVYASAEEVFIWLGYGRESQSPIAQPKIFHWSGDDTDVEIVKAYFERDELPKQEIEEEKEMEDVLGLFVYLGIRAMDRHLQEVPFFTVKEKKLHPYKNWPAIIQAAKTLLSNPWWTRIWVVQETVLARQATVIYCNITISWTVIMDAVMLSDRHDLYCCGKLLRSLALDDRNIMAQLLSAMFSGTGMLTRTRKQGDQCSLFQIMNQTHLRNAKDIRDKVFGVLGLVGDWQGASPIVPDYNLPPKEVFMQANLLELESTCSLLFLIGTTISGIPGIPSWVTERSPRSWAHNHAARARSGCSLLFSAAGSQNARAKKQDDILIVDGFEPCHSVVQVSPIIFDQGTEWKGYAENVKTCRRLVEAQEEKHNLHREKKVRDEDFWRTMAQDCYMQSSFTRDLGYRPEHSGNIFKRLENIDVAKMGEGFWKWAQSTANNEDTRKPHYDNDYSHTKGFFDVCRMVCFDRRFFITEDGHMGLGPPGMLPGDSIAILLGSNVPICLRTVPDTPIGHYTFVGDTYVHGLMDGEAVPQDWEEHVVNIHLH